ncbi:MAG: endonuclease MutS2 [Clostridiaceae bacterium]|nr:endonuclease MutS2 [Clostridiaceae bacterium]
MTMKEKSLATLEYFKVLELLAQEAQSQMAKNQAMELRPFDTLAECEHAQQQCADAVYLMGLYGSPSLSGIKDVSNSVKRAQMGGSLNPSELLHIASLLSAARSTRHYLENQKEEKTSIDSYFSSLSGNKYLEEQIGESIVSEEEISDSASSELYDIRRQIRAASSKIRDVLNKVVTSSSYSKMLQDSIVTQRNGRYVVPVKAEYRGSFAGLVHDVSSSGATLFIEPSAVVEQNNALRVLFSKERDEIERILYKLSAEVADFGEAIQRDYELLCAIDYIFARGKLAYKLKASRPRLVEKGQTRLLKARHPLLDQDKAVPIDFTIGGSADTVIITGPNTGGKTVSLKTLGLLTLMAQSGLQIPASEGGQVAIYKSVLADIGDEQSIEQSLSTFSSHMSNIVKILEEAGDSSIVLMDELGAGTDPVEGAALAIAIIERLREMGCRVAATTHYSELKMYALETKGVENASCEFDVATLKPTYKLVFGVPGKSNAFAISERLGIDKAVIQSAGSKVDSKNKRFEEVISKLEEKRQALESRLGEAEKELRDAKLANEQAQKHLSSLERERDKLILDAKLKANEIIGQAKRTADAVVDEARKLKLKAEEGEDMNLAAARAAFRGELSKAEKEISSKRVEKKAMPLPRELKAGDLVEIVKTGTKATVLESSPDSDTAILQAGILRITAKKKELTLLENHQPLKEPIKRRKGAAPEPPKELKQSIDVRGMTADEALMEVDRFIDHAARFHLEGVTVIHGKGTGVLRAAIQAQLKKDPRIKSFRSGVYGEGEMGVTVVTLK